MIIRLGDVFINICVLMRLFIFLIEIVVFIDIYEVVCKLVIVLISIMLLIVMEMLFGFMVNGDFCIVCLVFFIISGGYNLVLDLVFLF